MVTSRTNDRTEDTVDGDDLDLQVVNTFHHLGSLITGDLKLDEEIKRRLGSPTNELDKLNKTWNTKKMSLSIKIKLLGSLIMLLALYGCELCTRNAKITKRIIAFEIHACS